MRVPSPAAGMMTMTFIAGCKYTDAERQLQIAPGKRAPRMQVAPQTPKMMARTGIAQSSPEIKKNCDAGFGSAPTALAPTGAGAGTETPAEVAGTGTACRA